MSYLLYCWFSLFYKQFVEPLTSPQSTEYMKATAQRAATEQVNVLLACNPVIRNLNIVFFVVLVIALLFSLILVSVLICIFILTHRLAFVLIIVIILNPFFSFFLFISSSPSVFLLHPISYLHRYHRPLPWHSFFLFFLSLIVGHPASLYLLSSSFFS